MLLHRLARVLPAAVLLALCAGGPVAVASPVPPERLLLIREPEVSGGDLPYGGLGPYLARHGYGRERVRVDETAVDSSAADADAKVRALLARAPTRLVFAASLGIAEVVRRIDPAVAIVFGGADDPVRLCLARSLTRPALNATGVTTYLPAHAKMVETLHDAYPQLVRTVVLIDGTKEDDDGGASPCASGAAHPMSPREPCRPGRVEAPGPGELEDADALRAYAARTGLDLVFHRLCSADDLAGLAAYARPPRRIGIVVPYEYQFYAERDRVVATLARLSLPAIYARGMYARSGGLMALEPLQLPSERAFELVVQVLNGADPGSLPIQLAAGFALWINIDAARALGMPPSLRSLTRAELLLGRQD
ncbi:MAG: hypothetical protein JSR59_02030 [Proteobacteria bacterium]|nr:hypothetical protein [Pseudomonadota bacterium]